MSEPVTFLQLEGIDKAYPGVQALREAGLDLRAGEVHALVGENGAGKSTLMKVLSGALRPDGGTIRIDGRPAQITSPQAARQQGISTIYQEFNLVPALTARENIFLGRERSRMGFFARAEEREKTRALFERLGSRIDPEARIDRLTVAQQQLVEIAKALALEARVLIMDEPTAALTAQESDRLFEIIDALRAQGLGIIYISHRLEEVFRIADRVTVMRDGQTVGTHPVKDLTRRDLIEMMVGRRLENEFPPRVAEPEAVRLEVSGLTRGRAVQDVSFFVRRGEILALTGLVGAGRTETARLIFGADRPERGEIRIDGRAVRIRSPREAIRHRICLLTEDRKNQGLVLGQSVVSNFGLPNLSHFTRAGFVNAGREKQAFSRYAGDLRIKVAGPDQKVEHLSGGNQQKVLLARWLESNADVIIFDEPTRGIDVGAKYEIYVLMNRLASAGKAILMISSELPEVLGMADRILVMRDGRISGEINDVSTTSQEQIMALAIGAA